MSEFPAYQAAPQNNRPSGWPTHPLRVMSIITMVMVAVTVLLNSATVLDGLLAADADMVKTLSTLTVLTYLGAGIAFVTWERRARTNLDAFGVRGLKWGPGWTLGGWFIPLANLVIPVLVLGEIDKATATRAAAVRESEFGWGASDTGRPIFVFWAVAWPVNVVASYVAAALSSSYATAGAAIRVLVEVAAGVAAILLVLRITNSQEMLRRTRPEALPTAPPPAPAAWPEPGV